MSTLICFALKKEVAPFRNIAGSFGSVALGGGKPIAAG
jgi:hypothetical protein